MHLSKTWGEVAPKTVKQAFAALAFLAALLLLTPGVFGPPNRFDEGFVVSGAMMIARGWVPGQDFYVIYGPGQYYTVAALYAVFGEDLAVSRVLHALTLALLCGGVAAGTALVAPVRWLFGLGVAAGFVAMVGYASIGASYAALPATLLLLMSVWGFVRWFGGRAHRHLLAASLLLGGAGLYRWDFFVFGLAAHALAVSVVNADARQRPVQALQDLAVLVLPGIGLVLAGFGAMLGAEAAQRWVHEVPLFLLREFATWRGVDFIRPAWADFWWGLAQGRPVQAMKGANRLVFAFAPLTLALLAVVSAGARLWHGPRGLRQADAVALLLALLTLGLLNQMRVRAGFVQGTPAYLMALPLLVYLLHQARGWRSAAVVRPAALAASVLMLALPMGAFWTKVVQPAYASARAPADLPKAALTKVPGPGASGDEWARYQQMLAYIRARTATDEPIFSGVKDTSRLFINDAMLYFIADRPAATRWIEMEPGLSNTVQGQQEIIGELQARGVKLVVLWDMVSPNEPNATARSNGVHLLDTYLQARYPHREQFGQYTVALHEPPPPAAAK